jgi:hypothetical protein
MSNQSMFKRCAGLTALALAISPVYAQTKQHKQNSEQEKPEKTIAAAPVAVVNNPSPEYRSGEVSVAVRGNENPIIRLGLAPNGVTLVEFPASDNFFAINPGNTDLVTIEDSPTKETDHFFVIRPGAGFLPTSESAKQPATSIIAQMSSGMVVTFLLYPARDIESNAHRCVVSYDREAVVNARRAAGLAVNIDRRPLAVDPKRASVSMRIAAPVEAAPPPVPPVAPPDKIDEVKNEAPATKDDAKSRSPLQDIGFPGVKDKWSKPAHGLKIAIRAEVVDAKQRRVFVAVRNTLTKPVTIAPGYPELYVHTLDEKGRTLQTETLKQVKVKCSTPEGLIAPGETLRCLLTYEAPVLGAKQRLGVAVAQTNAADDPVRTELTAR